MSRNKNGKSVVNVPRESKLLPPVIVNDYETDLIAAVSTIGRLLIFQLNELPVLARGKGLKIIQIPPAKLKAREEYVIAMTIIPENTMLMIKSGQRHLKLKSADIKHYMGERGRRGNMLPRGFRNISWMGVIEA